MSAVSLQKSKKPCATCHYSKINGSYPEFSNCYVSIGKFSYYDNVTGKDVYEIHADRCTHNRNGKCGSGKLYVKQGNIAYQFLVHICRWVGLHLKPLP